MRLNALMLVVPLGMLAPAVTAQDKTTERTFDADEVKLLKDVFAKDQMLKELSKSQAVLKDFNRILSWAVPGPAKLAFKWNQAAFEGWGRVNSSLAAIGKQRTCDDLLFPIVNSSPNADFFENLRTIRGCE